MHRRPKIEFGNLVHCPEHLIVASIFTAAPLPVTVSEFFPDTESLVTVSAADDVTFEVVVGEVPAIVVVVAPGATVVIGTVIELGTYLNDDLPFQINVSNPNVVGCFFPAGIFRYALYFLPVVFFSMMNVPTKVFTAPNFVLFALPIWKGLVVAIHVGLI